ncbi:MAG TPA: YbdD/YjiX family protein [Steroidobacteraceae bacterium]|nr:YbdD/YjiX family protein [Steroidobacteraceae bacterium]
MSRQELRERFEALRRAGRQMFGIPDFERYCAHMREKHPGAPLMSEREFCAAAIDHRYGAGRPRCC